MPLIEPLRLSLAWDAIAVPYIRSDDYRETVESILRNLSRIHGRYVTLEPKGVKLLDALTDAAFIPEHSRNGYGLTFNKMFLQHMLGRFIDRRAPA